ncbi:MAG: deoxyribodipyrimidine photo-lyase [Thiobacillaceae bacterium]
MPEFDRSLIWFRRDLRLTDQAALFHALKSSKEVHCTFLFDAEILAGLPKADRRVEFIWRSVVALKQELEEKGGTLHVLHGSARREIPHLARKLGAQAVYCNRDYEPYALERDQAVSRALQAAGVAFHPFKDQVIFEQDEVLTQAAKPFGVFTPYKNAWLKKLDGFQLRPYRVESYWDRLAGEAPVAMPSLEKMGFERTNLGELGLEAGASGAHALFDDFLARIRRYREARDFPAVKGPSCLSVHLRFGTISIRQLVATAHALGGAGAETWLSELIWREFYQQVLWHHPEVAEGHCFRPEFEQIVWPNPPGHFESWCGARTGYPLVDAAMRQIAQTGYMHNRLRMVAASFLVKDLLVDWRLGERYFAKHLIDYDLAANSGGWQWVASVGCDAQPWFRIFNPVTQSEKFDPQGTFIRRYLPELVKVPEKFIHAPWKMPLSVQQACKVCVGLDYPAPIVEHSLQREKALAIYQNCLKRIA